MFATHLTLSNLINTDFSGSDLLMVNLSHSNMFNAKINDEQLHSAISIENTILPNGTIAHDIPLIRNGNAHCNTIVQQDWNINPINSIIITKSLRNNNTFNDQDDCMFLAKQSLNNNNSITMTQQINLTRYTSIISRDMAKFYLIKYSCEYYSHRTR